MMTDLIPLASNPTNAAVLLVDRSRPYLDLQECTEQRLSAVRGLLHSLASMNVKLADANDVRNLSEAAALLAEDALDLLKATRTAAMREGRSHA